MKKIVLTGGPCGGKTTVQKRLAKQFAQAAGWRVVCVPEAATLILGAGFSIADFSGPKKICLQRAILSAQIALEDALAGAAQALTNGAIMICDRGALDGKAYCSDDQWTQILAETGLSEETLLNRYEGIFHLPTLAGTDAYGQFAADNPCRFESVAEAISTDDRLLEAWARHPRRVILPCDAPVENKVALIAGSVTTPVSPRKTPIP